VSKKPFTPFTLSAGSNRTLEAAIVKNPKTGVVNLHVWETKATNDLLKVEKDMLSYPNMLVRIEVFQDTLEGAIAEGWIKTETSSQKPIYKSFPRGFWKPFEALNKEANSE